MGLFSKIFGKTKKDNDKNKYQPNKNEILESKSNVDEEDDDSNKVAPDEIIEISISSSPIGTNSGSKAEDFYVYEWFIKDTGEIFYVGKGRGDRYKRYHDRAYVAEKIRQMYETDIHFVATGLTEEQAIELESKEMSRILNETNDRLTNRIIPLLTKRDNGYNLSPNTPELKFETAPTIYATEIDEHYFGTTYRHFDTVKSEELKSVMFVNVRIREDINTIYGGNIEKYQDETIELLKLHGSKVLKTQYAKSITAWIYIGDEDIYNYKVSQDNAIERLGRNVPTYHLIDVWRFLKEKYGEVTIDKSEELPINPNHNRVALEDIRNLNNWEKGFDEGMSYWREGDVHRKAGDLKKAIELFDLARYNGYNAPALYNSYAMAYRKLKDYDNEIAILDEAIERLKSKDINVNDIAIIKNNERRQRALALKQKQNK